jgi:hypothetical protein
MLFIRKIFSIGAIMLFGVGVAQAEGAKLPAFNAPISESSISGISSGAFMSVQFAVAWSSVIKGVGVVAGGPYYCAQASTGKGVISFGTGALLEAMGPCMTGPLDDIAPLIKQAQSNALTGAIDATSNIGRQKIYVFHGYNDSIVARSVTDATAKFYRHYLGGKSEGNLFYQSAIGAGHSFVTLDEAKKGLDSCATNQSPYINPCGYDQAGILLQHIYGELYPPTLGPLTGSLQKFDQSRYTGADIPGALSLADQGFVFVPKDCAQGAVCRVHIALHGCTQDVGTIGKKFVELAGYNRWADANHIVVLYPQTTSSPFAPFNPQSCWDWWGYVTGSDSYVKKSGKQIAAIKAMLDAMTAHTGAPAPDAPGGPLHLILNDRADTSVALAWTVAPGATSYRVSRAGPDGSFQVIAEFAGQSFADGGLVAATTYTWQVAPLVNGVAQAASNSVKVSTLPTPAPCNAPGSCPLP